MGTLNGDDNDSRRRSAAVMLAALLSAIVAGCSESNPLSGLKLFPVKGKVALSDGQPLTSGQVSFVATKSTISSSAIIGSDGTFTFKGSQGDGLPEGEYKVRFEVSSGGAAEKVAKGKLKTNAPFATKYLDEDSSGLTVTVAADEAKNDFEFKLDTHDSVARPRAGAAVRRGGQ
jgi:hypothetical protein